MPLTEEMLPLVPNAIVPDAPPMPDNPLIKEPDPLTNINLQPLPEPAPGTRRFLNLDTNREWVAALELVPAPPGGSPGAIVRVGGNDVQEVAESITFTDDRISKEGFSPDADINALTAKLISIAEARAAASNLLTQALGSWGELLQPPPAAPLASEEPLA